MQDVPEIELEAAHKLHSEGGATFIDIRDPGAHSAGHIDGCLHWASQEQVDSFIKDTAKDAPIVIYCYHGNSSKGATRFLLQQGFTDVRSMMGGFEGWRSLDA